MGALVPVLGACLLMDGLVLVGRYALTLRLILAIVQARPRMRVRAFTQPVPTDGPAILVSGTAGPNPSDCLAGCDTGGLWICLAF